jgi:hypothetical protein
MLSARCKKCGLVEREGMGCVGSSIPVAFFKFKQQPKLYGMYAIQRQFNQDQAKSYKDFKQQREEKRQ